VSDALLQVEDLEVHFPAPRGRRGAPVRAVDGITFEV
jgi:ABC-type oligopeptide transport system ATPase subunit